MIRFIPVLMKVSALTVSPKIDKLALEVSEKLYRELFVWSQKVGNISDVNNAILINAGLIKVF